VPNPVLNEKSFTEAANAAANQPGWGAPTRPIPPSGDTASPWRPSGPTSVMSIQGTASATAVLLVLLCATAEFGWQSTEIIETADGSYANPPGWVLFTLIGGCIVGLVGRLKPNLARVLGPVYALLIGTALGAISKVYATAFDGIVLQAVIGTFAVLGVMLFLHATRILKVTDRFRRIVIYSTLAIGVVYLVDLILLAFDAEVPFIHEASPIGIGISLVVIVIAAFNLSLDFDLIERGVAARAPKQLEWYGALGLVMTLVWLYLEILRLLSKLQQR
jgi:uncharacterized YccA/Bax inhibitor family protein